MIRAIEKYALLICWFIALIAMLSTLFASEVLHWPVCSLCWYQRIAIYPMVLFHMQYDPRIYQMEGSPKGPDYGGFGKFIFVPQACPSEQRHELSLKTDKILYVDKGDCLGNILSAKSIYRKDGTKVFNIIYE